MINPQRAVAVPFRCDEIVAPVDFLEMKEPGGISRKGGVPPKAIEAPRLVLLRGGTKVSCKRKEDHR